jgi:hypothetical protein
MAADSTGRWRRRRPAAGSRRARWSAIRFEWKPWYAHLVFAALLLLLVIVMASAWPDPAMWRRRLWRGYVGYVLGAWAVCYWRGPAVGTFDPHLGSRSYAVLLGGLLMGGSLVLLLLLRCR